MNRTYGSVRGMRRSRSLRLTLLDLLLESGQLFGCLHIDADDKSYISDEINSTSFEIITVKFFHTTWTDPVA